MTSTAAHLGPLVSRRAALRATLALGLGVGGALLLTRAWGAGGSIRVGDDPPPLPAHAHNDYVHDRPLAEAISLGYRSLEVDVFPGDLPGGDLPVAHNARDITPGRTLRSLYLDPLREHVAARDGRISDHPDVDSPLILLVDLKREGDRCVDILEAMLREYPDLVTPGVGDEPPTGPVLVTLTGGRPADRILAATNRLVVLDGRPEDLGRGYSPGVMPLISASWTWLTEWPGTGEPPAEVRDTLRRHVAAAHAEGRLVRFWATPDTARTWDLQLDEGVDLVNVDALARFERYYRSRAGRSSTPRVP